MIHEIYPRKYSGEYKDCAPMPHDAVIMFDGDSICCRVEGNVVTFPKYSGFPGETIKLRYLFSIDEVSYFTPETWTPPLPEPPDGCAWHDTSILRPAKPRHTAFAAVTAMHLYEWYRSKAFCGACGTKTAHSETERAIVCHSCKLVEYPKISPVVIVAVTNGEHLLVTRYKDRPYRRYALVAGFSEIGESLEDTVRREVFEETGVRVKNLRYYKSQPWGFTSTLLSGFFCDLDGNPAITFDANELAEATWLSREEIPPADSNIALTSEMMEAFRTGAV